MLDPGWLTRPLIDAFIVAYLFVAWGWRHSVGTFGRIATEPFAGIVRWLGIGQDWSMFTPNPASYGVRLQIIIKRRSGAAIVWEPPRLEVGSASPGRSPPARRSPTTCCASTTCPTILQPRSCTRGPSSRLRLLANPRPRRNPSDRSFMS